MFDPSGVVKHCIVDIPQVSPGAIHIGPLRGPTTSVRAGSHPRVSIPDFSSRFVQKSGNFGSIDPMGDVQGSFAVLIWRTLCFLKV